MRPKLRDLRNHLSSIAIPAKAPGMQAYMKSTMPYHGVPSPILKKALKDLFSDVSFRSSKEWEKAVRDIWHGANYREERYAAIALTKHRSAEKFQKPSSLKLYEELIVTGAWWDYVDDIATHQVGGLLVEHPASIRKQMLSWSRSDDLWKRRTSIICQISLKDKTDMKLLYRCIEPSLDSKEFFLRKAIGWSLRQVAWRNPNEVIRYVKANKTRLSPLSKREALKNALRAGKIKAVP